MYQRFCQCYMELHRFSPFLAPYIGPAFFGLPCVQAPDPILFILDDVMIQSKLTVMNEGGSAGSVNVTQV